MGEATIVNPAGGSGTESLETTITVDDVQVNAVVTRSNLDNSVTADGNGDVYQEASVQAAFAKYANRSGNAAESINDTALALAATNTPVPLPGGGHAKIEVTAGDADQNLALKISPVDLGQTDQATQIPLALLSPNRTLDATAPAPTARPTFIEAGEKGFKLIDKQAQLKRDKNDRVTGTVEVPISPLPPQEDAAAVQYMAEQAAGRLFLQDQLAQKLYRQDIIDRFGSRFREAIPEINEDLADEKGERIGKYRSPEEFAFHRLNDIYSGAKGTDGKEGAKGLSPDDQARIRERLSSFKEADKWRLVTSEMGPEEFKRLMDPPSAYSHFRMTDDQYNEDAMKDKFGPNQGKHVVAAHNRVVDGEVRKIQSLEGQLVQTRLAHIRKGQEGNLNIADQKGFDARQKDLQSRLDATRTRLNQAHGELADALLEGAPKFEEVTDNYAGNQGYRAPAGAKKAEAERGYFKDTDIPTNFGPAAIVREALNRTLENVPDGPQRKAKRDELLAALSMNPEQGGKDALKNATNGLYANENPGWGAAFAEKAKDPWEFFANYLIAPLKGVVELFDEGAKLRQGYTKLFYGYDPFDPQQNGMTAAQAMLPKIPEIKSPEPSETFENSIGEAISSGTKPEGFQLSDQFYTAMQTNIGGDDDEEDPRRRGRGGRGTDGGNVSIADYGQQIDRMRRI